MADESGFCFGHRRIRKDLKRNRKLPEEVRERRRHVIEVQWNAGMPAGDIARMLDVSTDTVRGEMVQMRRDGIELFKVSDPRRRLAVSDA